MGFIKRIFQKKEVIKYHILKGRHSNYLINIGFTNKTYLSYECEFNDGALFFHQNSVDQYDINKLWGVSTSLLFHHKSSVRFGWRCIDGENIELFPYLYDNKERLISTLLIPMITVKPNEKFTTSIHFNGNNVVLDVLREDGREAKYSYTMKSPIKKLKYKLFPYFGGNKTAPVDIIIYLKKLK